MSSTLCACCTRRMQAVTSSFAVCPMCCLPISTADAPSGRLVCRWSWSRLRRAGTTALFCNLSETHWYKAYTRHHHAGPDVASDDPSAHSAPQQLRCSLPLASFVLICCPNPAHCNTHAMTRDAGVTLQGSLAECDGLLPHGSPVQAWY